MAELKLPFIGHGGDYNPDQWRDRPDILAEDIRNTKSGWRRSAKIRGAVTGKVRVHRGR